MHILYIHRYYHNPTEVGSTRSYWISKALMASGHKVTMLTGASHEDTRDEVTMEDGIKVIRLKTVAYKGNNLFKRFKAYFSLMVSSTRRALKIKHVDLVIATSTPLTIGFPALVLKKIKRTPYIFEVRDLWPEVPIQMGAVKNPILIKVLTGFEKSIYRNATHIVALSPGMEEGVINANTPRNKVSMIPNMSKIDKFWVRPANDKIMETFNMLDLDKFRVIYFGALGKTNAIGYVMEGIKLMREESDIEFIFIGYGPEAERIEAEIKNNSLENVRYLGYHNMEVTSEIVNLCQVSLVTFSDYPILATNSPNKLFDSLSAGKPLVVNSPGWTKKLVEENQCGIFVDPRNPEKFAEGIRHLKNSPELLNQMALNSRKLAETKYDKSILCEQFVTVVNTVEQHLNPTK